MFGDEGMADETGKISVIRPRFGSASTAAAIFRVHSGTSLVSILPGFALIRSRISPAHGHETGQYQ